MELALARIELMKDINPDSIHWEMFKNDYLEKEKEQMLASSISGSKGNSFEEYYNETYNI